MDTITFIGFLLFTGCCAWFNWRAGWLRGVELSGSVYQLAVYDTISYLIKKNELNTKYGHIDHEKLVDAIAQHGSATLINSITEKDDLL